jgi:flagellar hook-length control protein FliK
MRPVPSAAHGKFTMTMQTTSLPIQLNAPSPAQNGRASAHPNTDGVNFGAALTRQIEQRQLEQRQALVQPQPQGAGAGPKPQAPARPAANEAKPAPREMVKQAARETEHPDVSKKGESASATGAEEKTAAAEGESTDEAATSADAKVADSVVDMLALVASFNQVQQAAASVTPVAVAAQTPAGQAGALLSGMKESLGEGTEPLVGLEGDATLASTTDAPQDKAQPGIDLRALDLGKAADTARLPAEAGDFAARLRDSAAQAGLKEAVPGGEALTSLTAQASALQNAQATTSAPSDRLSARVGTPAWDNQVGQKVIWMVGGEDQSATLELNPPDLGPVQVVLNVSNDLASVTFSSQQLEVRQALENALPRLREMMSESGIALGDALVNAGAEGRQGQDGQGAGRPGGGRGGNGGGDDGSVAEVASRQRTRVIGGAGAVDTFA